MMVYPLEGILQCTQCKNIYNLIQQYAFFYLLYYLCSAISIRSTNVYEERSMGIFDDDSEDEEEVEESFSNKPRAAASYIAHHARKQLAFDIWWLAFACFLSMFFLLIDVDNSR